MNCATVSLSPGFVYASNSATTVIVSASPRPLPLPLLPRPRPRRPRPGRATPRPGHAPTITPPRPRSPASWTPVSAPISRGTHTGPRGTFPTNLKSLTLIRQTQDGCFFSSLSPPHLTTHQRLCIKRGNLGHASNKQPCVVTIIVILACRFLCSIADGQGMGC